MSAAAPVRRRPITDAEYRKLTPQQRIALGLDDPTEAAPADFGGAVLPNPNHLRPLADTDSGIEATRLPDGIKFQHDNFRGAMGTDISNPAAAELITPAMQTVAAKSEGKPVVAGQTQTVPMFAPDGSLGDIPAEKLHDALAAGYKQGVTMKSADGKLGVVPADRMPDAAKGGLVPVPLAEQETQHPGFWKSLGEDLKAMVPNFSANGSTGPDMSGRVGAATKLNEQQKVQQSSDDAARKAAGYSAPYRAIAPVGEGLGVNVKGMENSAAEGDVAGVAGHAAAVPTVMAGTAALAKAAPVISDAASAATKRAAAAAAKMTPKQAVTVAGTAGGALIGHGLDSAYFGSKLGHVAEVLLGKDRANTPIFQKAATLDEATDALAEVIARDRAAQSQASTLGKLPATGARPAAQTGEGLATQPQSAVAAQPKTPANTAPRFTVQDRAAAKSLLTDALEQHTGDVIDQMVPGKNAAVKSRVDFYLKKGDVAAAESELDKGAKAWKNLEFDRNATKQAAAENTAGTLPEGVSLVQRAQQLKEQMMAAAGTNKPAWTALDRRPVPSTNEIRARVQANTNAPKPGTAADTLEDHALQQEMNWDLQRHGWAAESEARREFIARNSTGTTKGELAQRFAATQSGSASGTAAQPAAAPGTAAAAAPENDLTSMLQRSLEAARKQKAKQ